MRWLVLGLVLVSLGAVLAAAAPKATSCTEIGTPARDIMAGTAGKDVLCARGGGDYLAGGGKRDVLRGDGGADAIVGGRGPDRLLGQAGDDKLFAVDGSAGDTLDGGPGIDSCYADPGDRVSGCERTFRGASVAGTNQLSSAFLGQGSLAEQLITTPTVPPPVVVTVTVTANCGGHPAPPPIC